MAVKISRVAEVRRASCAALLALTVNLSASNTRSKRSSLIQGASPMLLQQSYWPQDDLETALMHLRPH
jgi:hypothetical protein